ncbi:MAG: GDP-L-fucose synthase [Anaerolineales bacterium]
MSTHWPDPKTFWSGKRVCVTGGEGFLGSYVLPRLAQRGVEDVFVPSIRDYDLVQQEAVCRLLADSRPDVIIHLAANVGGIGANLDHPAEFFYDNLMMGVQLMHEAWQHEVEKFITVGTVCAYPKFSKPPFQEDALWDGYPEETNAPYGLAKKMLLVQAQAYRLQYGFNAIYLLPANLYGPRDNFDLHTSHIVPALIRKCIEAKERGEDTVVAWGTGNPTRELLYADDAARGLLLAAERYNQSDPVNLGTGNSIRIKDLVRMIADLTGFIGKIVWDKTKPDGQPQRSLDTSRAEERFGFKAQMPLEEGLRRTIKWYQENRKAS